MSLFDDAAAFMKNRTPTESFDSAHEDLIKKLRAEFENATRMEIEHALDKLKDRGDVPTDFNELLKKIRIWLDD